LDFLIEIQDLKLIIETIEKCSFLFKFKEGDPPPYFGGLTIGIHRVFRGLKFEPDPPVFGGGGKKGCFAKVSNFPE